MLVSDLLWALVGGAVVGVLGTWLSPHGRDEVPLWVTVLCGVAGVVVGNTIYISIWEPTTPGLDWWRHIWQIGTAAVLVGVVGTLVGRRRR
jgi:uncharacterized membrane protein YeaQ/YmgE (transglycosylase-associated protein family)